MGNEKTEFIFFEGLILNKGSILQIIPFDDWEWADEDHKEKRDLFVIHFLGGGSLKFPMEKFDILKNLLVL